MGWDWERFFTLEAIPTWLATLGTAAFWVYQAWKSKQGHHVICTQLEPPISHLHLSDTAGKWLQVQYTPEDQQVPVQIDTLSQTLVTIWNDSTTDTLNNVELEFHIPDARVLEVWWEKGPNYLLERSQLAFSPEEKTQNRSEEAKNSPWRVRVLLPELKSWNKYKEDVGSSPL